VGLRQNFPELLDCESFSVGGVTAVRLQIIFDKSGYQNQQHFVTPQLQNGRRIDKQDGATFQNLGPAWQSAVSVESQLPVEVGRYFAEFL
jgi:hypothetical protein